MNTSYSNRPLGGFSPSQTYFPSGVTYSLLHKSLGILLLQREQGAWARLEEFPWNIRVAVGFNNWHNTNMAHVAKICQIISPGSKLYPLGPHDYGPCHVLEAELQWLWTSWPRVRNFWGPNSSWAPLTHGHVMSSNSYWWCWCRVTPHPTAKLNGECEPQKNLEANIQHCILICISCTLATLHKWQSNLEWIEREPRPFLGWKQHGKETNWHL